MLALLGEDEPTEPHIAERQQRWARAEISRIISVVYDGLDLAERDGAAMAALESGRRARYGA